MSAERFDFRFDPMTRGCDCDMVERTDGCYVRSEDYDALAAQLAEAEEHIQVLRDHNVKIIKDYEARLAEAEALRKDAERWRHEWQRECADTDLLLQGMGLCPSEYRSEGGSLLLGRISHKLKQRGGLS